MKVFGIYVYKGVKHYPVMYIAASVGNALVELLSIGYLTTDWQMAVLKKTMDKEFKNLRER